jgi:hypothetical protein
MTWCFSLRDYSSTSKAKIAIFQLRDSALNWWGNLERQLHLGNFLKKGSEGNIYQLTTRNNRWENFML